MRPSQPTSMVFRSDPVVASIHVIRTAQAILSTALFPTNNTIISASPEAWEAGAKSRASGHHSGTLSTLYHAYKYQFGLNLHNAKLRVAVLYMALIVVFAHFLVHVFWPGAGGSEIDVISMVYNITKPVGQSPSEQSLNDGVRVDMPHMRGIQPKALQTEERRVAGEMAY